MFIMTAQEWIDKFTSEINAGLIASDDEIAVEYWTFDDVRDFVAGDDHYGEVTAEAARKVFEEVTWRLRNASGVDNDLMRDTISEVLDEMQEEK
jgi:hypothetical protein